ncbi:MAG: hypothetical protein ABIF71_13800 [Planctomycetota bacterium]
MKKLFWIIYGSVTLVVLAGGIFVLRSVDQTNVKLDGQYQEKKLNADKIEAKINENKLPTGAWPQLFQRRLEAFQGQEEKLKGRLSGYNAILSKKLPGSGRIELFDGEFKQVWGEILTHLLKGGFEVSNAAVTLANLSEQFNSGALAQPLGISMGWVAQGRVTAVAPEQRKTAELQYWLQAALIKHFMAAETANEWAAYEYKRKEPVAATPGMDGGRPAGRRGITVDTEKKGPPPPALVRIVFAPPEAVGMENRRDFSGADGEGVNYITKGEFTDEHNFSAEFKVRLSSLPAFINNILADPDVFFVIDGISTKAIMRSGEDDKIARDFKGPVSAAKEPPVTLFIKGRVLFFDFTRLAGGAPR